MKVDLFAGQDYRASDIQGAILCAQMKRLDPGLAAWRERVAFAADAIREQGKFKIAPHRDEASAANLALQFDSADEAQNFCAKNGMKTIFESAGRHIFTNWTPLVEKRTYRPDVSPFLAEYAQDAHYDASAAPHTLDLLKRTVYLRPNGTKTRPRFRLGSTVCVPDRRHPAISFKIICPGALE